MPGGGARGQNLGHLYFGSKFWFKFHWWCISHEPMIRNQSYFNHRYPIGFALFLSVRTSDGPMIDYNRKSVGLAFRLR